MREHKYKAYDKRDNKVKDVISIDFLKKEVVLHYFDYESNDKYTECAWVRKFSDIILMEYTGLKDRIVRKDNSENKEIYRCDIIKALNRNYDCEDNKEDCFQLFEVTYFQGCYMFGNWNAHEFFNKFMYIEVVGNIYENTELLKKV